MTEQFRKNGIGYVLFLNLLFGYLIQFPILLMLCILELMRQRVINDIAQAFVLNSFPSYNRVRLLPVARI